MFSDLRYALRSFSKTPAFTATIVLTFALGIGANTAIFSFVNSVLLQPLPYQDAEQLVRVESRRGATPGRISMRELEEMRELGIFQAVAAYIPGAQYNMSGEGTPEEVPATLSTSNLFDVLGVPLPQGGVWPREYDLQRNFGVVISHELWQRKFGGDPGVIGQKITLDAAPFYTVFGILPPRFGFPDEAQLYRSIAINDTYPNYKERDARNVFAVARLKPGVTQAQAGAALETFGRRLAQEYPEANRGLDFALVSLRDFYVGDVRPYLLLLSGAVALVLLIACANVVNLLVSRALAREKEIALRTALGAGRGRLIRQLLTESLLLALVGGAAGLLLAFWSVNLLRHLAAAELPPWMEVGIDTRVLLFTFVISVLTGVIAGMLPALQVSRPNLDSVLKEGARGSSGGASGRVRRLLVMGEIALALVLLVCAGLMVKSFARLQETDLGFNPQRLLTFRVALPWSKFSEQGGGAKMGLFYQQALERLAALPGVESAALNSNLPLTGETEAGRRAFTLEGQPADDQTRNPFLNDVTVSPSYFQTAGIPLRRGRLFTEHDTAASERVGIVSEKLANLLWPGEDPIGKRLKVGKPDSTSKWTTVIGVVGDVRHDHVTAAPGLDLYVSYLQVPGANMYLLLRTKTEIPASLGQQASRAILEIDRDQSSFDFHSMEARIGQRIWQQRIASALFVTFAALAFILAAVGIYGLMAYSVRQRTREIGIRIALGADRASVLRLVMREVGQLVLFGGIAGLLCALALSRLLSGLLYGVSPSDPLTFAGVLVLLSAVALLAGFLPAQRATRIDPMLALRDE
jgi:putative ABC transport system permease protein